MRALPARLLGYRKCLDWSVCNGRRGDRKGESGKVVSAQFKSSNSWLSVCACLCVESGNFVAVPTLITGQADEKADKQTAPY